jgi:hypothetical protein
MTLLEDYLDGALARAAERPGWAGVSQVRAMSPRSNGHVPEPAHWTLAGAVRQD